MRRDRTSAPSSTVPPEREATVAGCLWREHPLLAQALGLCPLVVVTNSAAKAVALGLINLAVLLGGAVTGPLVRKLKPAPLRSFCFMLVIAALVSLGDYGLGTLAAGLHRELGIVVSLLAVNGLILLRREVFAARPLSAAFDALGVGAGFLLLLLLLGGIREILGGGALFGMALFGSRFEPWQLMRLPAGGFLTLALLLLAWNRYRTRRARAAGPAAARPGA